MNTYLIPVTESYGYNYEAYVVVYAASKYKAYLIAVEKCNHERCVSKKFNKYITYPNTRLPLSKDIFYFSEKGDILKEIYKNQRGDYMADVLYDKIYMKDYNKNISDLAAMAIPEPWTYKSEEDNLILKRYLTNTFERLLEENKISVTEKYLAFNTGLYTTNYESIYLLAEKFNNISQLKEWVFKGFCTEYDLDSTDITIPPERADYFSDPSLLIFDWHYPVRIQYGHILNDDKNKNRLPKYIADSKMKLQIFTGVVDTSIKKVIANYKLAVPQYHEKKIQLLIPLFFENDNKLDLALVLTKKDGYYQGHTCLTLDMAYNNARLIAKPESNWLCP